MSFFVVCGFFKLPFLKKKKKKKKKNIFQEYHQSFKQFGSRSLIWVQTVFKGYQKTTKVASSGERVNSLTGYCLMGPLVKPIISKTTFWETGKYSFVCELVAIQRWSVVMVYFWTLFLTFVMLIPDIPCLCKQYRSRSVGFWRCQLI